MLYPLASWLLLDSLVLNTMGDLSALVMDVSGLESACLGDVATRIHTPSTVLQLGIVQECFDVSSCMVVEKNGGGGRGQ